jgi:hypothetical protein
MLLKSPAALDAGGTMRNNSNDEWLRSAQERSV